MVTKQVMTEWVKTMTTQPPQLSVLRGVLQAGWLACPRSSPRPPAGAPSLYASSVVMPYGGTPSFEVTWGELNDHAALCLFCGVQQAGLIAQDPAPIPL